jgi:hypothetical protein
MLEYVFFQEQPRKRFQELLKEQGLVWTLEPGEMETVVVIDETGMDAELADRIEAFYDELFAMEQADYAATLPKADREPPTAVAVRRKDGRTVFAELPPELVARVLTAISPEELQGFVDAIVDAAQDSNGPAPDSDEVRAGG